MTVRAVCAGCGGRNLSYLIGDSVEAGLNQALDGILVAKEKGSVHAGQPGQKGAPSTNFLVAEVLINSFFQALANLFTCDGLKIGRGENAVNDAGVGDSLFVGH